MTKILIILGPTATGKSDLAVRLARRFGGEVISADSRQVYKNLNIGTGKITRREMRGIRHHLLDVADPKRQFSVQKYRELAKRVIVDIASRGRLPIICGGTGFYIDAVLGSIALSPIGPDPKLRKRLASRSADALMEILEKLDPLRARTMRQNYSEYKNTRRLIRAIEIAEASKTKKGRPAKTIKPAAETTNLKSAKSSTPDNYDPVSIGLQLPGAELKKRIRERLLKRLRAGMIAEARRLHNRGLSWRRMEELGLEYRYLARYLQGKIDREQLVAILSAKIWQYARRQMTWFRRNKKIKWFGPDEIEKMDKIIKKSFGK